MNDAYEADVAYDEKQRIPHVMEPPQLIVRGNEREEFETEFVDLSPLEITVEKRLFSWLPWPTQERVASLEVDVDRLDKVPIDPKTGDFELGEPVPVGCMVEFEWNHKLEGFE